MRQRRDARTYTMTIQNNSNTDSARKSQQEKRDKDLFYCWECVSLVTQKRTIDFVIENRNDMLTFINAMKTLILETIQAKLAKPKYRFLANTFQDLPLQYYKFLMFKMKLSYMAWVQRIQLKDILLRAINNTVEQQKYQVIQELKAFRMTENLNYDVLKAKEKSVLKRMSVFVNNKDMKVLQGKTDVKKRRETLAALLKVQLSKMNTFANENKHKKNRHSFIMIIEEKQKQQTYLEVLSKELKPFTKLLENNQKLAHLKKSALSQKFYIDNYLSSDEEQIQNNKKIAESTIFQAKQLEQLVNEEIRILNFKLQQVLNLKAKDQFFMINDEIPMYAKNKRRLRNIIDQENTHKKEKVQKRIDHSEFWRKAKQYRQILQTELLDFNKEQVLSKVKQAELQNIVKQKSMQYKNERYRILNKIKQMRENKSIKAKGQSDPELKRYREIRENEEANQKMLQELQDYDPLNNLLLDQNQRNTSNPRNEKFSKWLDQEKQ
eukprot:403372679